MSLGWQKLRRGWIGDAAVIALSKFRVQRFVGDVGNNAAITLRWCKCQEWIVARKQFVAAIAGKRDSNSFPRERTQKVGWQQRRIA